MQLCLKDKNTYAAHIQAMMKLKIVSNSKRSHAADCKYFMQEIASEDNMEINSSCFALHEPFYVLWAFKPIRPPDIIYKKNEYIEKRYIT